MISQLKERVAFLEGLVMSLVTRKEPSANSTATRATSNTEHGVSATIDKTSEEWTAFLEGLVMSLVAKNEPAADSTATQANTNPANDPQAASTITNETSEEEIPCLMRLPPEIRIDILKRVLQPVFEAKPYGLTPPLPAPVTIYTGKSRFPAVLHVNQTLRAESMRLYLGLAQTKTVKLESKNKKLYDEYNEHKKNPTSRPVNTGFYMRSSSSFEIVRDKIKYNYKSLTAMDATCKALQGTFRRK